MQWEQVLPGVWRFRDSCNVYAVQGAGGIVIIDAGTGAWLDSVNSLPAPPVALLCTHYFRDHSAGAVKAARAGIPIYAPEHECAVFTDPAQHFRQRETYIIYDNLWDLYAPIEHIPLAGVMQDYEVKTLAGLQIEAIPLPGATMSQTGYGVTLATGQRVVFCGEAIHSSGKLPRVAPLQYNYNELSGAYQCAFSVERLREWRPDILLPSLGTLILFGAEEALLALKANLRSALSIRSYSKETLDALDEEPLVRVTDHVWLDARSVANTWYVLSDSGKALAIDYGYHSASWHCSTYAKPERRRALLHGLTALKKQFGIEKIDTILVSHFHDDHVCGIPVLQRLHGTQCWAAENFADLLEHPEAHCFPCTWPVPIKVDQRLPLDASFTWEEYTFHLHPMSGHTRFSALIGFEADGVRFAHTGDQYFFNNGVEQFEKNGRSQNHVYRNGALLDGYSQSAGWMLEWRPQIVLQGHQPPMHTSEAFFQQIADWDKDYAELHRRLMPLEDDETHFNLDSWGGWIWPYRTHLPAAEPFSVTVTVRNPLPQAATLAVQLVGPEGWSSEGISLSAEAHTEVTCTLTMTPPDTLCRRQPFAVELTANGQPFGQVAEALITIGNTEF